MAVELTTEQSERLERILRGIGGAMSPEAARELRARLTWDLSHPQPPGEVHRICEELRSELGTIPNGDGRTADELLGYDSFGLPT